MKERDRDRERQGEAGRRCPPVFFFISAHTSNKDIHHTHIHPPLHFLPLWTSNCVFSDDRESSVSAGSWANYDVPLHLNDQKITLRKSSREDVWMRLSLSFKALTLSLLQPAVESVTWADGKWKKPQWLWPTLYPHKPSNNLYIISIFYVMLYSVDEWKLRNDPPYLKGKYLFFQMYFFLFKHNDTWV